MLPKVPERLDQQPAPPGPGSATRTVLGTEGGGGEGPPPKGEVGDARTHSTPAQRPGAGRDMSGSPEGGTPGTRPLLKDRARGGAGKRGPGRTACPSGRGARCAGRARGRPLVPSRCPSSRPGHRGAAGAAASSSSLLLLPHHRSPGAPSPGRGGRSGEREGRVGGREGGRRAGHTEGTQVFTTTLPDQHSRGGLS